MLGCDGTSPGAAPASELLAAGCDAAPRGGFCVLPPSCGRRTLLSEGPAGPEAEMSAGLGIPAGSTARIGRRGLDKLRRDPALPGLSGAVTTAADDVHGPGRDAARVISGPQPTREVTVNRIRRVRLTPALKASPLSSDEPSTRQPRDQELHLVSLPGGDGQAGRFIQPGAVSPSVAPGQNRAAPTTMNSRRRTLTMPRLLPHTVQLCIHCRHNPAGFWVSRAGDQTVRRPWCLSCCQDLDPASHHISRFDP